MNAIGVKATSECIRKVRDVYNVSFQNASLHFKREALQ